MKTFIVILSAFISSAAMASGFVCSNDTLRAKVYNQVQPELGTKNAAVLIVSEKGIGTLARLTEDQLSTEHTPDEVTYSGQSNSTRDGRFVSVNLVIGKSGMTVDRDDEVLDADGNPLYAGILTIVENGEKRESVLECSKYRKGRR